MSFVNSKQETVPRQSATPGAAAGRAETRTYFKSGAIRLVAVAKVLG
jgi:hypothetical protein